MRSTAFTMNRLIFCFLAVIYSSGPTLAGHNLKQETVYFEPLMGYKELPNLTVNAIHQDVYGLIWIGTNDGLVCYNGSDYRNYKFSSKDETSISSKKVTAIGECPVDGDLWIATSDGLNLFDRIGDKFERYPFKNQSGESVSFGSQCIGFDSAGNVLVGTFFGLPILNCTTKEWDLTYTSTGRFDTLVKDIHKTAEDEFLLATTSGFHKLSLVTHELSLLDESPRHPNGVPMEGSSVLIDELQRLWLGTLENGVHVFDSKGKPLSMSAKGSHYDLNQLGSIQYIKEDHHENIWIGSLSEGLFVAASGNESLWHFDYNPNNSQAIPAKLQNTALVTENGKLLFGTKDEGIYFYDPSRQDFEIFNRGRFTNRGLILSNINKAVEETSGKVWLGGGGRRLNRFNPLTKEFEIHIFDKFPEGEKTNGIYAWCIDRNNWMWIISRRGNLYTWDFERDLFWKTEIRAVNFEPEPGLLQAQMYADSQGMLWFMGNGLYKFNPRNNEMELIGKHDRIPSRRIAPTAVFETAHGDLWFGTQGNGFYFYSRNLDDIEEGYMPDLNPELLTDTRVTSLYQENEDYLWIATESGLGRFHTKRKEFDNPDFLAPLLDTGIYGLQPDEEGDLWAMTAHDLTKIDLGARQLLHYDEGDGLLTANFSGKPFLKLQSGSFLIGGDAGFNLFYPEYINPHAVPGKVTINKIEVIRNDSLNHSPLELPLPAYLSKRLELSADQNFLTIHYASMDPGKSARVNYATRLVGLENNWSPASKLTQVTYTDLKPGSYVFEVAAQNRDKIWNPTVTRLAITIITPFYLTAWFKALIAGLVLGLIVLIVKYRTYQVNAINRKLAHQVYQRTRDLEDSRNEAVVAKAEAEEANRLKSTFLAAVSHEIRTPINGVIGLTSLMKRTKLDAQQADYLQAIDHSGSTLLRLINDLLDFSKLEAGKFRVYCHECDLRTMLQRVVQLFEGEAKSRGLNLVLEIETDLPAICLLDEHRLTQVLSNLISNAIKFTETGSVLVRASLNPPVSLSRLGNVELHEDSDENVVNFPTRLFFSVTDTGVGILPEDQTRLFESFIQAKSTVDRKLGGTGIGLAISKRLTNLMGGDIAVASVPDAGSTFAFCIQSQAVSKDASPKQTTVRGKSQLTHAYDGLDHISKVLIVDDNYINCTVAEGMVKHLGYFTKSVRSGRKALEVIQSDPYDLILMDIQMPDMDGYETTRAIRSSLSGENQPVIIAMTADAMNDLENHYHKLGLDGVIVKPITEEKLIEQLSRHNLLALAKKSS